jgi:penicillin-binding protein 2
MKIKVVNWVIFFLFLFLSLAVLNLQLINSRRYRHLSNKNCIRLLPQEGCRGNILDRQGKVMVGNRLSYDLAIIPQDKAQTKKALLAASRVLGRDVDELERNFKNGFIAPFAPVVVARDIEVRQAIALEELKPDITNMIIQMRPVRDYPYGKLGCHIFGYLNEIDRWRLTKLSDYGYQTKDIVGFGGLEEKYDYYLRPEKGGLSLEVDHRGKFVRILGFKPPRDGKDIQLTIDLDIQKIVEDNLANRQGSVIIMDPSSGEIIAMASAPDFNPKLFVKKTNPTVLRNLFNDPQAPLINRAISGVYPPGSIFKLIVAYGALDTKKISTNKTFFCPGSMYVGRREFRCWDIHQRQNLSGAIIHSCDVFFYHSGLIIGAPAIHDYALRFGFGKATAIDLPYESSGFVPSPLWKKIRRLSNWFDGDTANFSIGQGDLMVTPIQTVRMVAVFANRGLMVKPYLVQAIDDKDISVYQRVPAGTKFKEATIDYIAEAMRSTVSEPSGTANILAISGVQVAGKTGTVQVPHGQSHAWFIGFFPFKNPKFAICVFLEHGGSGQVACMLSRRIIEEMLKQGLI